MPVAISKRNIRSDNMKNHYLRFLLLIALIVCTVFVFTACDDSHSHDEGEWLTLHDAKAPTCDSIGWDAYTTCSKCDYSSYKELAALGHDDVAHDAKAPTCTEIGWNAYVTCSRCEHTTYSELAALGHDDVAHDAKAPT